MVTEKLDLTFKNASFQHSKKFSARFILFYGIQFLKSIFSAIYHMNKNINLENNNNAIINNNKYLVFLPDGLI